MAEMRVSVVQLEVLLAAADSSALSQSGKSYLALSFRFA
jgi:hypothetical protein